MSQENLLSSIKGLVATGASIAQTRLELLPARGVADDVSTIEGRAQHGRVSHITAISAGHAGLIDAGHRNAGVVFDGLGFVCHRQEHNRQPNRPGTTPPGAVDRAAGPPGFGCEAARHPGGVSFPGHYIL